MPSPKIDPCNVGLMVRVFFIDRAALTQMDAAVSHRNPEMTGKLPLCAAGRGQVDI